MRPACDCALQLSGLALDTLLPGEHERGGGAEDKNHCGTEGEQEKPAWFRVMSRISFHLKLPPLWLYAPGVRMASTRASRSRLVISVRPKIEYTAGTVNSVISVATSNPPITARPSGAFIAEPDPRASAIG